MKIALILFASVLALHAEPIMLFNGKDLEGWRVQDAAYWSVKDGVLVGQSDEKKKNSILWTERKFKDFKIDCEFRFSGDIDSGFFLRNPNEQIQIGVSRSLKRDMTGSPYIGSKGKYPVEAKEVGKVMKPDEWNAMSIVAKGNVYTVSINGTQVLEYTSDTAIEEGPIGLQVHSGVVMKVEFKGLVVEEK
jgi:hypothetical protein